MVLGFFQTHLLTQNLCYITWRKASRGIGPYMNSDNIELMCCNKDGGNSLNVFEINRTINIPW